MENPHDHGILLLNKLTVLERKGVENHLTNFTTVPFVLVFGT